MKISSYSILAEYTPTLIITIFIVILLDFHDIDVSKILENIDKVSIETDMLNLSGIFVIYFLFSFLIRYSGKHFFEKRHFNNGLDFPTTHYLLSTNTIKSPAYKKRIFNLLKIENNFDYDEFILENDIDNEKKIISEQIGYIRTRVNKDGEQTLTMLTRYGFFRNLIGGLIILFPLFIFEIILILFATFIDKTMIISSVEFFIFLTSFIGVILVLFRKRIINNFATEYANKLLDEFTTLSTK